MIGSAILVMVMGAGAATADGPDGGARSRRAASAEMIAQVPTNAMLGTWTAPDGSVLTVAADGGAYSGRYRLDLRSKKGRARAFQGLAHLDTIHFSRNGRVEILRPEDERYACLRVGVNERYCRSS